MSRPGLFKMLVRGAFRRCPWCGGRGAFFVGWFKKADCCQTCGLEWRRDDVGYELGGMVAVTWPDVNVPMMFVVLVVLAFALPLLLYGSAYVMWQAIDIMMRPPTPLDFRVVGNDDADAGAVLPDGDAGQRGGS